MQLDLFADSRDVMLRNDVLDALQRHHASDARQTWERLIASIRPMTRCRYLRY